MQLCATNGCLFSVHGVVAELVAVKAACSADTDSECNAFREVCVSVSVPAFFSGSKPGRGIWGALDASGEYTDVDEEVDSILPAGCRSGAASCDLGVEAGDTAASEAFEEGTDGVATGEPDSIFKEED